MAGEEGRDLSKNSKREPLGTEYTVERQGWGLYLKQQEVEYPLIFDMEPGKKCIKWEARDGEEFDLEYVDFEIKLIKQI